MLTALAGILSAALTLAAAQANAVPADARAVIAAANADWVPALQARDASRLAAPYADDGIFVTATGDVVKGRDAVAQLMRERLARMGTVVRGRIVQDGLTRQGSSIYEWGHAVLELARKGAPAQHSGGRYLTVWQNNAAGRWAIVRNLSFSD